MNKNFYKANVFVFLLILFFFQKSLFPEKVQAQSLKQPQVIRALYNQPFHFIENKGQVDKEVKFYLRQGGGRVYFTNNKFIYQFIHIKEEDRQKLRREMKFEKAYEKISKKGKEKADTKVKVYNILAEFVGANPSPKMEGQNKKITKYSYFKGNDPDKWIRGAPAFGRIVYRELYPRVDLVVYGRKESLKYEYKVKPRGKVESLGLKYENVKKIKINKKGQLEIETAIGVLIEDVPACYQEINGKKVKVDAQYAIDKDNIVRLKIGKYQKDKELIIDPTLEYSTLIGGSGWEWPRGITIDDTHNAYITGFTDSDDFPITPDAYDTNFNNINDVFITKLNSTGTELLYSTFLGGGDLDRSYGIAIDKNDNVYVTGETVSNDFPTTPGAYDTSFNSYDSAYSDAFITKINSDGTNLIYSSYIGGSNGDTGRGIDIDGDGNTYITGYTDSHDFPVTPNAYDTSASGVHDVFVTKFNSNGNDIIYSTFISGNGDDKAYRIVIDDSRYAYITGRTTSDNFPTTSDAYDRSLNGNSDLFAAKINSTGTNLIYSTYLGGNSWEFASGIAVDKNDNVYVTGETGSNDFPTTPGAYDTNFNGGRDIIVTKINSNGTQLLYSTYLGGSKDDGCFAEDGIAIDSNGNAYITGYTASNDFPSTPDAFDTSFNEGIYPDYEYDYDAFLTILNTLGNNILYSTFLGTRKTDVSYAITLDNKRNVYITGETNSNNFPTTPGAFDLSYNGGLSDLFIAKFAFKADVVIGQGRKSVSNNLSYIIDYNALDGTVLKSWDVFSPSPGNPDIYPNTNGELSVAKGDVDGDGEPEIIVGQRGIGARSQVNVYNTDGQLLWYFNAFLGGNLNGMVNVAVGDVDKDGVGEIIVGNGPNANAPFSRVRVFKLNPYGTMFNLVTRWQAFDQDNPSGEVRVAAGHTVPGSSVGQIITAHGHGGNSIVKVWDFGNPPTLHSTFKAFGRDNPSGGVDVAVGNFDGAPNGRELILVGQGGPGETDAAPADSSIRIFDEMGTMLKTYRVFGAENTQGRITVSAGQADSDFAHEIIVGQAMGGNSHWRVLNYEDGSFIITVQAFSLPEQNPLGQVDVAGHKK
jgi:hypothetical protein